MWETKEDKRNMHNTDLRIDTSQEQGKQATIAEARIQTESGVINIFWSLLSSKERVHELILLLEISDLCIKKKPAKPE